MLSNIMVVIILQYKSIVAKSFYRMALSILIQNIMLSHVIMLCVIMVVLIMKYKSIDAKSLNKMTLSILIQSIRLSVIMVVFISQ